MVKVTWDDAFPKVDQTYRCEDCHRVATHGAPSPSCFGSLPDGDYALCSEHKITYAGTYYL